MAKSKSNPELPRIMIKRPNQSKKKSSSIIQQNERNQQLSHSSESKERGRTSIIEQRDELNQNATKVENEKGNDKGRGDSNLTSFVERH